MTTLQLEEKQVIETEISPLILRAKSTTIKNREDRAIAASIVDSLKEMREKIEERFHPTANKKKIYSAYEAALETEHAFYDTIDEGIKFLAGKEGIIKAFDTAEAIKAQREAERFEAERRDKEEKEREKLEKKAEKELEKGNTEKAEVLLEQAEHLQVAPSFTPPPVATKKLITKAEVINRVKLCKLIADGVIPFSVVDVNQAQLNAWAKTQDHKAEYEGIRLFQESAGRV